MRDEVAGDHHEVGLSLVGALHGFTLDPLGGHATEMQVGEVGDAQMIELVDMLLRPGEAFYLDWLLPPTTPLGLGP